MVIPYAVAGGGEVRFTVRPRYVSGEPVAIELDLTAGTLPLRGPVSGRVIASGLDGERAVRALAPRDLGAAQLAPGEKAHVRIAWDGRDDSGASVQAQTYSLSLDFIVGGEPVRLGSVIEVRAP